MSEAKPGGPVSKPPTMADVAARAGVSKALVSTVFRDVPGAGPATRERVLRAASELGYRVDNRARMLRRSRTRLFGVVFNIGDTFHADLAAALYPPAEAAGYDIVLSATTAKRPEHLAVESLLYDRCEALLLIAPQTTDEELEIFASKAPTISLARRAQASSVDVVRTRDSDVVRTALDHLQSAGHRRITMVDGGEIHGSVDRRRSYRDIMRRRGLRELSSVVPGGNTEAAGKTAAEKLLGQGGELPTAVITFNDRCAVGLMFEFRRRGVRVPEDVSVVGYDDAQMASLPFIDLTTVGQDTTATAAAAVARAVGRLDEGAAAGGETLVSPYFVERGTTRPV
jgi:DNA-binding LacI/PurR family transcriptional regulator